MTSKNLSTRCQVVCENFTNVYFSFIKFVFIGNITFVGCGGNRFFNIQDFVVQNVIFEGQKGSKSAVELYMTNAKVMSSIFCSNTHGTIHTSIFSILRQAINIMDGHIGEYIWLYNSFWVGGAMFVINSTMSVHHSLFEHNAADIGGAIFTKYSLITFDNTTFIHNHGRRNLLVQFVKDYDYITNAYYVSFAGVLFQITSNVSLCNCRIVNSTAYYGGAISSIYSHLKIKNSTISTNTATYGGAILAHTSNVSIISCTFHANHASFGGVLSCILIFERFVIAILDSLFDTNSAKGYGGVVHCQDYRNGIEDTTVLLNIYHSSFLKNHARKGGVPYADYMVIVATRSSFSFNYAETGGALHLKQSLFYSDNSNFMYNYASLGAVIYAKSLQIKNCSFTNFSSNAVATHGIIYLSNCKGYYNGILFSDNTGSFVTLNSNITLTDSMFINNSQTQSTTEGFQEGGSITLFQSMLYFDGFLKLKNNHAENGGAIHSAMSRIYVRYVTFITHNTADNNGGGIYLSNSELKCEEGCHLTLFNNIAGYKGGGIHVISLLIEITTAEESYYHLVSTFMHIMGNKAKFGGGISFEANAKLYINTRRCNDHQYFGYLVTFVKNLADYGGAVYVDDYTNSGTCYINQNVECFIQSLATEKCGLTDIDIDSELFQQDLNFSQNSAFISGIDLYGGLTDRCAVSEFAKIPSQLVKYYDLPYFMFLADYVTNSSIPSAPVKVCSCTNKENYCNAQNKSDTIEVKKGEVFSVSVVAVDQVGNPTDSSIQSYLKFPKSGLAEGQLTQPVSNMCTNLSFSVTSLHSHEELTLYSLTGPCKDAEYSIVVFVSAL